MIQFIFLIFSVVALAVPNPPGRPSKAPFISGDGFRAYSDYCYDEVDRLLDPASVKPGGVIFVKSDFLGEFFANIHPLIHARYILISHNSDAPTPGPFISYLDDEKIIAWFSQNYDGQPHPKIHPIPMGIANFCWEHGNADQIQRLQKHLPEKIHLAHMQFTVQTFPEERMEVFQKFSRSPYCYQSQRKRFFSYLADLASSKFSIAPRGHAYDTHRIWESLYVGTIPIVKTSSLDSLYSGLPILIIRDWNEVNASFLEEKYRSFCFTKYDLSKLSIDYWISLIDSYK